MINSKDIIQQIESLESFKIVAQTYEEIAATRMRKVRSSVVTARDFINELNIIFQELRSSYKDELAELMRQKRVKDLSKLQLRQSNGKTVSVLLSANSGLYGEVLTKTYSLFRENIEKTTTDIVIIGKYGESQFLSEFPNRQYQYFEYPDKEITPDVLKQLLVPLLEYDTILVYYGKFDTIANQDPVKISLISEGQQVKQAKEKIKYFFEPSLEKILAFFEEEIAASLFEQTLHEAELAKFASRMITMDSATGTIDTRLKQVKLLQRITTHRQMNKKQQEALTGISLWKPR